MNEWKTWMNEWNNMRWNEMKWNDMNWHDIKWINELMKEGRKEGTKERTNEGMKWKNERMKEGKNEWMKEQKKERTHERTSEWNAWREWRNERSHQRYQTHKSLLRWSTHSPSQLFSKLPLHWATPSLRHPFAELRLRYFFFELPFIWVTCFCSEPPAAILHTSRVAPCAKTAFAAPVQCV